MRRGSPAALLGIWMVSSMVLHSVSAQALETQLPNMKPLPPIDLRIGSPDNPYDGTRALRFTVRSMNIGDFPLDLLGIPPEDTEHTSAMQCVRWAAPRVCAARERTGTFAFHPRHSHWHFNNYALYELRTMTDGEPDMSESGLIAMGTKASFCLMDGAPAEEGPPPSSLDSQPFYSECVGVLQGISPRWEDGYGYGLVGQEIVMDDVPDGVYALVVSINPLRQLFESSYADNLAFTPLVLSEGGTAVDPIEG